MDSILIKKDIIEILERIQDLKERSKTAMFFEEGSLWFNIQPEKKEWNIIFSPDGVRMHVYKDGTMTEDVKIPHDDVCKVLKEIYLTLTT